jgi:hypothetical protein
LCIKVIINCFKLFAFVHYEASFSVWYLFTMPAKVPRLPEGRECKKHFQAASRV